MSVGVLILSILFAGVEVAASWLMLEFSGTAALFAGVPLWLITAIVFSLGMLLSFLLIILVGVTGFTSLAADFVHDNFGRTLALMLAAVVLIFCLSSGAEALYQLDWVGPRQGDEEPADICFVLDFSGSMTWPLKKDAEFDEDTNPVREEELKQAFAEALGQLKDGQRFSVVCYNAADHDDETIKADYPTRVVCGWQQCDDQTRAEAINGVEAQQARGDASYAEALSAAAPLVSESAQAGHTPVVILFSDGADGFGGFTGAAEAILTSGAKVYGVGLGKDLSYSGLREIVQATGGKMLTADTEAGGISEALSETNRMINEENITISTQTADTLLTAGDPRHEVVLFRFAQGRALMRILLLFVVAFVFKLVVSVCIGNNQKSLGSHLLSALVAALIGALAVEFGYQFGLPLLAVESVFWLLMMMQIVISND